MSFPTLELSADELSARHFQREALPLGISVKVEPSPATVWPSVEAERLFLLVARSPHGQAALWCATRFLASGVLVTDRDVDLAEVALRQIGDHVGVLTAEFTTNGQLIELHQGPHPAWLWTLDGSRTSAFEQHLRALLDLPLGDTSMSAPAAITAPVIVGEKPDMYYPYLHLMARDPGLRVHQMPLAGGPLVGHLTVLGEPGAALMERAVHAMEYFSGAISE